MRKFERKSKASINPPVTAIMSETIAMNNVIGIYGINLGITSRKYNGSIARNVTAVTTFKNYIIFCFFS